MEKRIAIVTGATRGIGKAIVLLLIRQGYLVIMVDVDDEQGGELEKLLGKDAQYIHCDISIEKDVIDMFERVIQQYRCIDAVVNNAGIVRDNMIWKMPVDDFDQVVNINLKGTWLMCREAAKQMKIQHSGRIVNITSRAWLGNMGQSNYAASKAGVVALTRVLALELGKYNVLVNAVAPGLIDTPLTQNLPADVIEKLIQAQPTKKMGTVDDVARVVGFLCDPDTGFITGQTIYVDGGKSIGAGL